MYHYLVGLRVRDSESLQKGELIYYVDSVLSYGDEDVENVKRAMEMVKNEMWPTTSEEACQSCLCSGVVTQFNALCLRARFNNITLCLFHSELKLDPEWFSVFFRVNNKEYLAKKISEARINI